MYVFLYLRSMAFKVPTTILALVIMYLVSGAQAVECSTRTIALNVTSTADVQQLTDVLNCAGPGEFNITWYTNQTLTRTLGISNMKNVTIVGSGNPTVRGGLYDGAHADGNAGSGSDGGIFSVYNASMLHLSHLNLAGGNSHDGAAVNVLNSSTLSVIDCTFEDNSASYGGETLHGGNNQPGSIEMCMKIINQCVRHIFRVICIEAAAKITLGGEE